MAGNTIKLLVVEDDFALNDTVRETISELGEVTQVHDGDEGWFEIESGVYDAVVLDVMLPGQDGFTILKKAKDMFPNLPILMLTAKGELSDKMQGFNLGADEYITKPFYKEELLARLKTLLRHTGVLGQDGALEVGNVQVFIDQHRVLVNDQEVHLQGREFGLLVYLMQHVGQIVTKDQIFDRLWGFDSDTSLTVVEVYMSNLRKNLRNADAQVTIKTLRNVGYTLNAAVTED
ncbi:DNA-binding response regulator [Weissella confusa]|uniref:response regulator transcription factor n=1 Tax=Weissella confusa TaxID=1583 RepID=UPI00223C26EF|nr:response regulator transcription factor [Weissella confusa]MCS9991936.1 DNA-binding response regulator [Weissella confusa]